MLAGLAGLPLATPRDTDEQRVMDAWKATTSYVGGETFRRHETTMVNVAAPASGVLRVVGGLALIPGKVVTSLTWMSGSTALATGSNQWMCVIRKSDLAVLAKTTDDTSAAWGTFTLKTFTLASPITPTEFTPVYLGLVTVATTNPSSFGVNPAGNIVDPHVGGTSTTGLTDPASLGANAAAITPGSVAYARLNVS
jgi:hypothetical protein